MTDALIVFLKAPRPGAVKTRLAATIGTGPAAGLYRALAEAAVRATDPLGAPGCERLYFFAPADAGPEMEAWLGPREWIAQAGGDLGKRMAAAFGEAFRRGARRAAIVGTDVPGLTERHARDAFAALDAYDAAVGPARDGGYYLLALDRPRPALFEGVPWSTAAVLSATLARARSLGLAVRLLEELGDVDTVEDLRREWETLRQLPLSPQLKAELESAIA
jgi:rSAM/selenodomain-associated transferase 1